MTGYKELLAMRDDWRELRRKIRSDLDTDPEFFQGQVLRTDIDPETGDLLVTSQFHLGDRARIRVHRITITEVPPVADRCPACRHPWEDHADDGCQAPVTVDRTGPYDCNCTERKP